MKKLKIKKMTLKEATEKIDNILNGKEKSFQARLVKNWFKARQTTHPKENVRKELIREMYEKHNGLAKGTISLEDLTEETKQEMKKAKTTGI